MALRLRRTVSIPVVDRFERHGAEVHDGGGFLRRFHRQSIATRFVEFYSTDRARLEVLEMSGVLDGERRFQDDSRRRRNSSSSSRKRSSVT